MNNEITVLKSNCEEIEERIKKECIDEQNNKNSGVFGGIFACNSQK